MKINTVQRVITLGALAIIGILAIQTYWVLQTLDIKEKEFNQTVSTALIEVAKEIAKYNGSVLPSKNLVSQRSSNYFIVNINDEIDANLLAYYLQKEFEIRALNIDFEYGIYDCSSDKMVYGELISYSNRKDSGFASEDLPKYGDLDYYFGVRFPKRTNFLLGSLGIVYVLSGLLLITIAFFIYSMFVIIRQRRLSKMQKDFINNMTHEFKTPISTIKISADVFKEHARKIKDARLSRYAEIIKVQNERLNSQVEKVLQLARIEKNNFQLNLETIKINDLLLSLVNNAEPKLEELGGEISLQLPAEDIEIQADKTHTNNVLYNLIDNAIKYSKNAPKVAISLKEIDNHYQLKVKDNGIGIPKEVQPKIFDKFYRVPTGNVHDVKGFGLGLFYISNICKSHGWDISLESQVGKGTTVTLLIKKEVAYNKYSIFNIWRRPQIENA